MSSRSMTHFVWDVHIIECIVSYSLKISDLAFDWKAREAHGLGDKSSTGAQNPLAQPVERGFWLGAPSLELNMTLLSLPYLSSSFYGG